MDRQNLEPGDGMLQAEQRLQALLCRAYGKASEGHGAGSLSERFLSYPSGGPSGAAPEVEAASHHLRELYERPVSCRCTAAVHPAAVPHHATVPAAYIPGAYQAERPAAGGRASPALACQRLDGRKRGKPGCSA